MTILTAKETEILNIVTSICEDDYSAWMEDIMAETSLPQKTVTAVLGTLTQKNRIYTEREKRDGKFFDDIFALTEEGEIISYGEIG